VVHEVFISPVGDARPSPDGPRDRIEKCRLAGTVLSNQAGEMHTAQVNIGLPMGQEVAQAKQFGNHRPPLKPRATMKDSQLSLRVAGGVWTLTG